MGYFSITFECCWRLGHATWAASFDRLIFTWYVQIPTNCVHSRWSKNPFLLFENTMHVRQIYFTCPGKLGVRVEVTLKMRPQTPIKKSQRIVTQNTPSTEPIFDHEKCNMKQGMYGDGDWIDDRSKRMCTLTYDKSCDFSITPTSNCEIWTSFIAITHQPRLPAFRLANDNFDRDLEYTHSVFWNVTTRKYCSTKHKIAACGLRSTTSACAAELTGFHPIMLNALHIINIRIIALLNHSKTITTTPIRDNGWKLNFTFKTDSRLDSARAFIKLSSLLQELSKYIQTNAERMTWRDKHLGNKNTVDLLFSAPTIHSTACSLDFLAHSVLQLKAKASPARKTISSHRTLQFYFVLFFYYPEKRKICWYFVVVWFPSSQIAGQVRMLFHNVHHHSKAARFLFIYFVGFFFVGAITSLNQQLYTYQRVNWRQRKICFHL